MVLSILPQYFLRFSTSNKKYTANITENSSVLTPAVIFESSVGRPLALFSLCEIQLIRFFSKLRS